jgi:hypothetical protein
MMSMGRFLLGKLRELASRDDNRRAEVRAEVRQLGVGANGDSDGHVVALAVGVGQLDLIVVEEAPRIGHGQRQRRVVQLDGRRRGAGMGVLGQ